MAGKPKSTKPHTKGKRKPPPIHRRGKSKRPRITRKHLIFIEHYALNGNGTQAALAAGYNVKTAGAAAYDLLKRPHIIAAIEDRKKREAEAIQLRGEITRERIAKGLMQIAELDPKDIAEWGPNGMMLKPSEQIAPEVRRTIQSITNGKYGPSLHTSDRLRALELLCKILNITKDETPKADGQVIQFYLPDNGRSAAGMTSVTINGPVEAQPQDQDDGEPDGGGA